MYTAIGIFVFIYVATVGFYYSGERIARALRHAYFKAVLSQNMAFFDMLGAGEVATRITSDIGTIQEAITSKMSLTLTAAANFASAFAVMFVMYWKTALILSPTFLIMIATMTVGGAYAVKFHEESRRIRTQGSNLAEEAIASARNVSAFGIQNLLAKRYHSYLSDSSIPEIRARSIVATMIAWSNALPCLVYALSFFAGSFFLVRGEESVSAIATTTLAIVISAFAIIRIAPSFQALTASIASASVVLKAISRRSPQDPFAKTGLQLDSVTGDIEFEDVSLSYPSRENVQALTSVQFRCQARKTTAIVGASGCGKSSIVGLLQRFYEPTQGRISG